MAEQNDGLANDSANGASRATRDAVDEQYMRVALDAAKRGSGFVSPNPLVGAVVVSEGSVAGVGWHALYGGAHAEVNAIHAAGDRARGATLYVTLEPCNHFGKTAPCTNAILDAGISRVVFATADNSELAKGGAQRLREAGVLVTEGVLEAEAKELNAPFFFVQTNSNRPWVTIKLALSLDGAIADSTRKPGWITGSESRAEVHRLRASVDAIAVGLGTVKADNPLLTVREAPAPRVAPIRVVFDKDANIPLDSALVESAREHRVVVVSSGKSPEREAALHARGVTVVNAATSAQALETLRGMGVRHLLVEGGERLASELISAGLAHRLIIFQAPVILGNGSLTAFTSMASRNAASAPRLRVLSRAVFGADIMTVYALSGDL